MYETQLSDKINRIRYTARSLMAFKFERRSREDWCKFWGCCDTLRDVETAFHELLTLERMPTMLECIGFLQALVTQQDAIYHLSASVGSSDWRPTSHESLKRIRDLRNRISAHAAWSDRSRGANSSSMLSYSDIRADGFKAVVYLHPAKEQDSIYEDIDFSGFIKENESALLPQIEKLLDAMNQSESQLHLRLQNLDWTFLDNTGDGYFIQKLWHPWEHEGHQLGQTKSHIRIFSKRLEKLSTFVEENHIYEVSKYKLKLLRAGIDKLRTYLANEDPSETETMEYDLMLEGWLKVWDEFDQELCRLKEKIGLE